MSRTEPLCRPSNTSAFSSSALAAGSAASLPKVYTTDVDRLLEHWGFGVIARRPCARGARRSGRRSFGSLWKQWFPHQPSAAKACIVARSARSAMAIPSKTSQGCLGILQDMNTIRDDTQLEEATTLDSDLAKFRDDLGQASDVVVRLHEGLDRARVTPASRTSRSPRCSTSRFPRVLSRWTPFCRKWKKRSLRTPRCTRARVFSAISTGAETKRPSWANSSRLPSTRSAPSGIFLQRLRRSNVGSSNGSRSSSGIRLEAGGCLLSGGSSGNLVGLAVARKQKAPFDADVLGMRGGPPLTVVRVAGRARVVREEHGASRHGPWSAAQDRGSSTTSRSISRRWSSRSRQIGQTGITRFVWWEMPARSTQERWIHSMRWRSCAESTSCGST